MAGVDAGGGTRLRGACALLVVAAAFAYASPARALEAFDGRLQTHGFVEEQVRVLDRNFNDQADLAQWYNVLNVEIEGDILPDGWGPFNLLQSYVRLEGRYDCIYSDGCGPFPSVNTYGEHSRRLPKRLSDAVNQSYGGVVNANDFTVPPGQPFLVNKAGEPFRFSSGYTATQLPALDWATDSNGNYIPDPKNPAPGNPMFFVADGNGWRADCTAPGSCRALPAGQGISTTRPTGGNSTPPPDPPPVPSNDAQPITDQAYLVLLDNPDLVVTDPLTGETDTVRNLYGMSPVGPRIAGLATPPQYATAGPGVCPVNNRAGTCPDNRPILPETNKRMGFPGFDTLFDITGADGERGDYPDYNNPDPPFAAQGSAAFKALTFEDDNPGRYTLDPVWDWRFTARRKLGNPPNGDILLMGPWRPKNTFHELAALQDRANPVRGRLTPTYIYRLSVGPSGGTLMTPKQKGVRYMALDTGVPAIPYPIDPVDPRLTDMLDLLGQFGTVGGNGGMFPNQYLQSSFGGDFSGIVPCLNTVRKVDRDGWNNAGGSSSPFMQQLGGLGFAGRASCIPYTNVAAVGGSGELPMRPGADLSNLTEGKARLNAQGLYIPSPGLTHALQTEDFDKHEFNISELDRAFNHGASQQETYEVKEAYFDMEFLDSRLWLRLGLQNIVWGKTELFRTTDQFNPQDFALASLPALEESRIALFSGRAVYSLYDVGPLEDVRLEVAANFDKFKPADLGACGEPFTPDVVCQLTLGIALHSVTGVGIAGVDRPPDPWKNIKGLEFGGRLEFRWDRFSFAITDFYGYNDFPYPDPIMFYERNVDPNTGRPRIAGATGPCENAAGFVSRVSPTPNTAPTGVSPARGFTAGNARIAAGGDATAVPTGWTTPGRDDNYAYQPAAYTILGIGVDPACLKPGGAPNFPGANGFVSAGYKSPDQFPQYFNDGGIFNFSPTSTGWDPTTGFVNNTMQVDTDGDTVPDGDIWSGPISLSPQNALQFSGTNQTLFSFVCSATVGIAVALSPGSCAWNLFGSTAFLDPFALQIPFTEVFSTIGAGETSTTVIGGTSLGFMGLIMQNTKNNTLKSPTPLVPLNADEGDGRINATNAGTINAGTTAGFNTSQNVYVQQPADFLTMDQVFTNEQKALLGCGPFYGTRCDSSSPYTLTSGGTSFPFFQGGAGGIDFANAEASVFTMAWPGLEGTHEGWRTTSTDPQPGTIDFVGGEYCTRYVPDSPDANGWGLVRLPGCRGVRPPNDPDLVKNSRTPATMETTTLDVVFDPGYTPMVDGCVFGATVAGKTIQAVNPDGSLDADLTNLIHSKCGGAGNPGTSFSRFNPALPWSGTAVRVPTRTLFAPLAGCEASPTAGVWNPASGVCVFRLRDFDTEYANGTAQIFRNEMAAWSWNLMLFLVEASCNTFTGDDLNDGDCFNPQSDPNASTLQPAWDPNRCSLVAPQYCRNVKGIFGVAGLNRNDVRAGGNPQYGRRDFIWHSGGELILKYARRNVFGFSTDFAEDYTKTNWGMEFTWIGDTPFLNNDSLQTTSDSQVLNLTVSVDRPTFINFLNANRTFFFNSQWFFQYVMNYDNGFTSNGPFNVLFTFAVFTGYFQDRLQPQVVTVYDFNSVSGGFLPSISYRFTDAFSVTLGVNFFVGHGEWKHMPVQEYAPTTNRAGPRAYNDSTENLLSLIRARDEAYLRLRWTF